MIRMVDGVDHEDDHHLTDDVSSLGGAGQQDTTAGFDNVEQWPNCNPDVVVRLMKKLDTSRNPNCLGSNKKAFYSSYPLWALMNGDQKTNQSLIS